MSFVALKLIPASSRSRSHAVPPIRTYWSLNSLKCFLKVSIPLVTLRLLSIRISAGCCHVEQSGIIFIDEIDKIAVHGESHGQDVSREGVQRDILPIVEGSNVNTKFGVVDTTHILFIAAGAFSVAAPSDLIPELQGRFPLRVELDSLHKEDFKRILSEPKNSLIMQYTSLLETEGVKLDITEDALDRMSTIAEEVNASAENIGARRLHTIMEKVLADINFEADEHRGETIKIDAAYVDEKLEGISQNQDLSRYIL